jgi:hypothetical protein
VALPHARQESRLLQTHTTDIAPPVSSSAAPTTVTDQRVTTAHDPYAGRRATSARLVQAIYLVFGMIEGLLLIRFFLRALGANAEAGFAQAIYGATSVLVAPFVGLFGTPQISAGAALELSTLVALIVYAVIGWTLARAAWLMFGESRSSSVATVSSEQTRIG